MENNPARKASIRYWAEDDRPREKLNTKGRSALSDAELIAILIGSGTKELSAVELAKEILRYNSNSLSELGRCTVADLMKFRGIGEAKAISIVAALELGRRRRTTDAAQKNKITSSQDAFDVLYPMLSDHAHEQFWVLLLNRGNQVIKKSHISKGGVSGTVADAKVIFKEAVDSNASAVILSHNHPSGNLKPSDADIKLTRKLKDGGQILDIAVLDHLIIGENSYYSFADEGML